MIVDASLLVELALPSSGQHAEARLIPILRRMAAQESLRAPGLATYEVGNVVHFKRARDAAATLRARQEVLKRALSWVELDTTHSGLLEAAGKHCERERMTFYDASYLAHAQQFGEGLLTADRRLHAHAQSLQMRTYLFPDDIDRLERDWPLES